MTFTLSCRTALKKKWAKIPAKERSDIMSKLVKEKRWDKTSKKERLAHMKMMNEAAQKARGIGKYKDEQRTDIQSQNGFEQNN